MLGAVSVASRRPLALSPGELGLIERLARRARRFDRRRDTRSPV
jgi:hypothetical protein